MRPTGCAIILLLLTTWALAQSGTRQEPVATHDLQTGYCPQTRQLEAEPSQRYFLEGAIGKRHVRMYLDRGGSSVVGLFFEMSGDWPDTLLGGTWKNGDIDASDGTEDRPKTGDLKASLTNHHLSGKWVQADGGEMEPVELDVVPQPRCDGKETWKRFEDPGWAASFSYPASWHLEKSENIITLTCPDPSEIAYDQHVTINGGSGKPSGFTHLVRCGQTWIYGEACDCSAKGTHACPAAKVRRTRDATVLDVSEREWRNYCAGGGYVSQGEGVDRVVLFGDRWIEIAGSPEVVERLTTTVRVQPPRKSGE